MKGGAYKRSNTREGSGELQREENAPRISVGQAQAASSTKKTLLMLSALGYSARSNWQLLPPKTDISDITRPELSACPRSDLARPPSASSVSATPPHGATDEVCKRAQEPGPSRFDRWDVLGDWSSLTCQGSNFRSTSVGGGDS